MKLLQEIKVDIDQGLKSYYVYILYKPDGTPFYVGKGKSNRISAHEAETRYFIKGRTWKGINTFKLNVIKKLWDNNQQVYYEIDSWHDLSEDAGNREVDLVLQIGRRIFNEGPLVNIRDGGNVWSEETRQLFSEKMKQYWSDPQLREQFSEKMKQYWSDPQLREQFSERMKQYWLDNPMTEEMKNQFSERMKQYWLDNPMTEEMKNKISESMIDYIKDHPEFVDNLMISKDKWIEQNPEEYEQAEAKRLEICRSQEHRELKSKIAQEHIQNYPEELERLYGEQQKYWSNESACEEARQRAIDNKSHEAIIKWLKEEPEACREKWSKHSGNMKKWYQSNPDQVQKMIDNRNKVLKSEEHREKMSNKTKDFLNKNPEIVDKKKEQLHAGAQQKKKIRMNVLELVRDKLVLSGEIKYCEPTAKRLMAWRKNGIIDKYFPDFPVGHAKINDWKLFLDSNF